MIFEDASRRRWRRALVLFSLLALAALVSLALLVSGMLISPPVPQPFEKRSLMSATDVHEKIDKYVRPVYTRAQIERMARIRAQEKRRREWLIRGAKTGAMPLPEGAVVAFLVGDDPAAVASLERHIAQIDVVVPTWLEMPGPGCDLVDQSVHKASDYSQKLEEDPIRRVLSRANNVIMLPRLANLSGYKWRGLEAAELLANEKTRTCVIKKVVARLLELDADGINIDIEELAPEDSEPLLEFLVEFRAALHTHQMRLTVSVPLFDPAYDIEYIGSVSDAVMVMAYDEHFPTSQPGPIASRAWFVDAITEMKQRLPADRMVVILGAYGYNWQTEPRDHPGYGIAFRDVSQLARASGAKPIFEENLENSHFAYKDAAGSTHDVWFQDALTIWNQVHILQDNKITRMGLWRLGTEDQTMWSFFGFDSLPERPDKLIGLPPPVRSVEFYGNGEVLTIRGEPQSGVRNMEVDPSGRIERAAYIRVPTGYLVERRSGNPRQLVLSFDDGPAEPYTIELLDALKELKAPALFFLIGQQIIQFPDIVDRIVADGHLIGNHTFSHPHLEELTPREAEIELNTNQRLIEGLTGLRTPLFRSPYETDVDNIDQKMFSALQPELQAGYLVVGSNVISRDWTLPGVEEISKNMIDQVVRGKGQILLFHDGGGDRSQTVEAVKQIVIELRKRGYEFVSLDRFLNIPRTELEQPLPAVERIISEGNAMLAFLRAWGWVFLTGLFFICTMLAILRILFLGSLAIKDLRRKQPDPPNTFRPLVTVLVPAYNEEKVIANTVHSLLESEYANLEVLVVDDGSRDHTAAIVTALAAETPRVRLVQQANAGKAAAANHGLREARGEIIVAVDADTIISSGSIPKLVRHFYDPKITAVCGNVEVGNVKGFLTTFQAIEYVTSQNFDRRAFSALNCISVVPGALGAWRREAVLAADGYSPDSLTEDADLTLTILRRGGRVVYEPEAYGRTEAPEKLSALLRQRFRWTFGTYQCLWKHRQAFFHGSLGWVGLPNMVLFQILFPTLSPLGDVLMLLAILRGDWSAFLSGYVAFLVMDVCGSLLAFTLDKKPLKWLLLLIIQRFSYRQIMYYVSLKAMIAAIRGRRHGWRKLDRTGSVALGRKPGSTPPIINGANNT